ncbi:hypothetical protein N7457_008059 [Penicillium paradoxum]|uniref:uncharacterized protein n=1 Tax=Penicillium paradoxum TaxID=176176 RepID=UPI002549A74F|nr:uncharacterized protein N7457_008059 [Penicillium paradoxum]KAJ5773163.1 hypothetical protein N7457_008059 [Penicillium paradoxum]
MERTQRPSAMLTLFILPKGRRIRASRPIQAFPVNFGKFAALASRNDQNNQKLSQPNMPYSVKQKDVPQC